MWFSLFETLIYLTKSYSNFNASVKATHLFDAYNMINNFSVIGIDEGQFVNFFSLFNQFQFQIDILLKFS